MDGSGLASDTALSAFVALPGQRSYDLADLVLRFLHRELRAEDGGAGELQLSLDGGDETRVGEGEAVRARAVLTSPGFSTTSSRNAADGACSTRWSFHSSASSHRWNGPESPSTSTGSSRRSSFGDAVKRAADDACAAIGHEVNLGSPKQLQVVLFDDLQMPKTKRTKTGYTTDADALAELYAKTEHPFLEALLRHR